MRTKYNRVDYKKIHQIKIVLDLMRRAPGDGVTYEDIIAELNDKQFYYADEKYMISQKTAERLVQCIAYVWGKNFREKTVGTGAGRRKYFKMVKWYGEFPIRDISPAEMQALNAAIKKTTNAPIKEQLIQLEAKLQDQIHADKKHKHLEEIQNITTAVRVPEPIIKQNAEIESVLKEAALAQDQVSIKYKKNTRKPTHIVSPLGLVYGNTNNYLVAYDTAENNKIKNFILGDIKSAEHLNIRFAKPADFSITEYARRSFGLFHSEHGPYDIEWRVVPAVAEAAKRYLFHPTQQITENADGSLTIKFKADGLHEMAMYLFQWGGKIIPVAPAELRDVYLTFLNDCITSLK